MTTLSDLSHEVRQRRMPNGLQTRLRKKPFVAICLRGPVEPVYLSTGPANYRGVPVRISTTTIWKDEIGSRCDAEHYTTEHRVLVRVWLIGEVSARLLVGDVSKHILSRGQELRKSWVDLGPDMDPSQITEDIIHLAAARGLDAWTDVDLVWIIDNLQRQEMILEGMRR